MNLIPSNDIKLICNNPEWRAWYISLINFSPFNQVMSAARHSLETMVGSRTKISTSLFFPS